MNRTKRQLLRCELARRLFIEDAGERPLLQADIIDDAEGTGQTVRVPKCFHALREHGISWGQVARTADSQIISVFGRRSLPPEIARMRGVAVLDPARQKWDELVPPVADEARGHFSRAFTVEHTSYDFASDYDPLGADSAHWTALRDGDYVRAESGKAVFTKDVNNNRTSVYRSVDADMSGHGADYGVEADLTPGISSGKVRYPHVDFRQADGTHYYFAVITLDPATLQIRLQDGEGSATTLASTTSGIGSSHKVYLEGVGTVLKVFLDGSETDKLSAADSTITSAGCGGISGYQQANTSHAANWDNFRVYVAPPEAGPTLFPCPFAWPFIGAF